MTRVTEAEVKEIYDTDVTLTPYITAANLLTNRLDGCGNDDATLKEIERYLAAHFAFVANPSGKGGGITSDKFGDASRTYGVQYGKHLEASQYGQQALLLDTCGKLAYFGKRKATMEVL